MDIFEQYGMRALQYDALHRATSRDLTPGELKFYKTFNAMCLEQVSEQEMIAAHQEWMDENLTDFDRFVNAAKALATFAKEHGYPKEGSSQYHRLFKELLKYSALVCK